MPAKSFAPRFASLSTATLPNPVHDKIRSAVEAFERSTRIYDALYRYYPHRGSKETVEAFEQGPLHDATAARWEAGQAVDTLMRSAGLRAVICGGKLRLAIDDMEIEDFGALNIEGGGMLDLDAPAPT